MKDPHFQRVLALNTSAQTQENFKQSFQEFDEVVEASMRIYMSDAFKGIVP